jgi:hypothetical protein
VEQARPATNRYAVQPIVAGKVQPPVPQAFTYRYEIRDDDGVLATGHLTLESPLEVGDPVTIGRQGGVVERVAPSLNDRELQLVVRVRS